MNDPDYFSENVTKYGIQPCPHCGKRAVLMWADGVRPFYWVQCHGETINGDGCSCGCSTSGWPTSKPEESVAKWNKRTSSKEITDLRARVADLEAALQAKDNGWSMEQIASRDLRTRVAGLESAEKRHADMNDQLRSMLVEAEAERDDLRLRLSIREDRLNAEVLVREHVENLLKGSVELLKEITWNGSCHMPASSSFTYWIQQRDAFLAKMEGK